MQTNYQQIHIDKSLYQRRGGFLKALEELDPTGGYRGSELGELTAFERQLRRFGIRRSSSPPGRARCSSRPTSAPPSRTA